MPKLCRSGYERNRRGSEIRSGRPSNQFSGHFHQAHGRKESLLSTTAALKNEGKAFDSQFYNSTFSTMSWTRTHMKGYEEK